MIVPGAGRGGACRRAAPPPPGPPGGRNRSGPRPARPPRGTGAGCAPQRGADQAERLEGRRDLPASRLPALPGDGDHAAVEQLGQVKAGGRRADPGQPGQLPRRQRAVRQQRPQDRGPGRVRDQRSGREVWVIGNVLRGHAHIPTVIQRSFDGRRRMRDAFRGSEFARAAGSTTVLIAPRCGADVAQLVEHHLAKVRVAGSNPVVRSEGTLCPCGMPFVAEWPSGLGKGLQSPVHGFDSRLRLHDS